VERKSHSAAVLEKSSKPTFETSGNRTYGSTQKIKLQVRGSESNQVVEPVERTKKCSKFRETVLELVALQVDAQH